MDAGSFEKRIFRRRIDHVAAGGSGSIRGFLLTGLLIGATGAAACGDEGPAEPIAECLEAAGVTGAAVAIRGFAFSPDTLRIATGTQVTWVNCEPEDVDPHTATSDVGAWGSELLFPGDTFVRAFPEAGSFPYHCIPHPTMQAVVIVDDEA